VSAGFEITVLDAPIADTALSELASVLVDCVEGGASVSFMLTFPVPGENGYHLYTRADWTHAGIIPDYAMFPDGRRCDTAIMWKRVDR
jgi:hypothetical protein